MKRCAYFTGALLLLLGLVLVACPTAMPLLNLSSNSHDFGAALEPWELEVSNAGSGTLEFQINSVQWAEAAPARGASTGPGDIVVVTVRVDGEALEPGENRGSLVITGNAGTRNVTLIATAPGGVPNEGEGEAGSEGEGENEGEGEGLAECEGAVAAADAAIEQALRNALQQPEGDLTAEALAAIEALDLSGLDIENLDGLQCCINLVNLNLNGNSITNAAALAGLVRLESLNLGGNPLESIEPLAELINLVDLDLSDTPIDSLDAVEGMENLEALNLDGAAFLLDADLNSLSGLSALRELRLSGVGANTALALENLTGLEVLGLSSNALRSVGPLAGLGALRELDLADNIIGGVSSLAGLAAIETLNLDGNPIEGIGALLDNEGLGQGDSLSVRNTRLDEADCPDINALIGRGVEVIADLECPPDEEGEGGESQ